MKAPEKDLLVGIVFFILKREVVTLVSLSLETTVRLRRDKRGADALKRVARDTWYDFQARPTVPVAPCPALPGACRTPSICR